MKKLGVGLLLCVLLVGACAGVNHWRYDETHVSHSLYRMTPLGTSYDDAWHAVSSNYHDAQRSGNAGFLKQDGPKPSVVGVKSIWATIGDYHILPFGVTTVTAYWGFDKDNHLIDVWVWKTTDSL